MRPIFRNRAHAGRVLAEQLTTYRKRPDVLVLGLPRGGLPVAYEVAVELQAPLDVLVVRKLGVPWHPELAMGAVATGGIRIVNDEVVRSLGISQEQLAEVTRNELIELERRERAYRGERPGLELRGETVILVDDGLATGSTMRAALAALRQMEAAALVVAVPVAAAQACSDIESEADAVICAAAPPALQAVGLWYEDFSATTEEEVRTLLQQAAGRPLPAV